MESIGRAPARLLRRAAVNPSALAAILLWGGSYATGKLALAAFNPTALVSIRYLVAAPLLLLILPAAERQAFRKPAHHRRLLVIAALGQLVNIIVWAIGLRMTTASHSVMIYATAPIWTAVFAAVLGHDRLRAHTISGGGLALVGISLIVWRGMAVPGASVLGDLITLVGALGFAVSTIFVAQVVRHYGSLACTAAIAAIGAVVSVPLIVISLAGMNLESVRIESWLGLVYSVFGAYLIAQILWNRCLGQLGSTQTMVYNYLQPVSGVALAALLLGEQLEAVQLAGAAVVLAGVALAQGRFGKR